MPTLADYRVATPLCTNTPRLRTMGGLDRSGQKRCCTPLTYRPLSNKWHCGTCGKDYQGEHLAQDRLRNASTSEARAA